jgi:hypothetical protein
MISGKKLWLKWERERSPFSGGTAEGIPVSSQISDMIPYPSHLAVLLVLLEQIRFRITDDQIGDGVCTKRRRRLVQRNQKKMHLIY